MNSEVKIAMKKIALADLLSLEAYEGPAARNPPGHYGSQKDPKGAAGP